MDSLKHMNDALAYIERNLAGEIDYREAALRALCSEYHFKRMFSFLAGVPLSEYVRRRRLTLAALELQGSGIRVIDLAIKYGYDSPDSFSRAFQQLHGMTPSEARGSGRALKAYPPMTFRLSIQGGNGMNYRIVDKEAFRIVGLKKRVPIVFEGVNPEIAAMWASLDMETIDLLKRLSNVEPIGLISASANFDEGRMEEWGELDHYIGAATTEECPERLAKLEVGASTWAVFEAVGPFPSALQDVWGRIYSEWFPSSGYELAPGPEILWNESKDTSSPKYRSEIWIPVVRR
ncbi:AraC family transcriptional regulator [Cohnella thailandensis]|uniref:AraC family transcriptional regulator n=1 Tax=Cohnella thailandensis TaxID=557557 RepID=A0A841SR08_9BACL|nr:AraC family transcriptional regulator [Cohnella thailandensis]MBB6633046.1 AraC family transcriptional regulator [Cohnella thailandensis]MBP1975259.1 AraC family transcriptional regulator [Cohnella thailandensis]